MNFEGGKELAEALKQLPTELAPRVTSVAMRKAAEPILKKIHDAAPEDTGRLRMFLSMRASTKKGRSRVFLGVMRMGAKVFARQGLSDGAYYAYFPERGTKGPRGQRAQHFIERTFEESLDQFLADYQVALRAQIDKAVRKLRKNKTR